MNFIQGSFNKLVNKFGLFKTVIFTALAVFFLGSLVISITGNAIESNRFDGLVSEANSKITNGDLVGAKSLLEQAKSSVPGLDGEKILESANSKIHEIELSQDSFASGEKLQAVNDYAGALIAFGKVSKLDTRNHAAAIGKIAELKPLAVKAALLKASSLASKGMYSEAKKLLADVGNLVGVDAGLTDATAKYAAAEQQRKEKARAQAISRMRKKHDAFNGVTWYTDYSSPNYINSNAFYLYFGASNNSPNTLRLVVRYFADNWLFVKTARVSVDGTVHDLTCANWERDNNSEIWEWCDEPLMDRSTIEEIIKSKSAVIRFDGDKYYDTRTISSTQKQALKNVLAAYDNF